MITGNVLKPLAAIQGAASGGSPVARMHSRRGCGFLACGEHALADQFRAVFAAAPERMKPHVTKPLRQTGQGLKGCGHPGHSST